MDSRAMFMALLGERFSHASNRVNVCPPLAGVPIPPGLKLKLPGTTGVHELEVATASTKGVMSGVGESRSNTHGLLADWESPIRLSTPPVAPSPATCPAALS